MKRLLLLLLTAAMLVLFTAALSHATDPETVTVTFTMPENHYYMYIYSDEHNLGEYRTAQSLTLEVEKGHVLTAEDVEPFTVHCPDTHANVHKYCRVTMTGWDRDPVGMEITEDTEFFAQMNENTCTVTVRMDEGFYDICNERYESFDVHVDKGYTITEDDVERFSTAFMYGPPGSKPQYEIIDLSPDPLGMVVEEDITIVADGIKRVYFAYYTPDFTTGEYRFDHDSSYDYVYEGTALKREDLNDIYKYIDADKDDIVEAYWDVTDEQLSAVHPTSLGYFEIYGRVTLRGDCNQDILRNTADAVAVLRYAAKLHTFTEVQQKAADTNKDGKVNTADAVLMLQYAAGISD